MRRCVRLAAAAVLALLALPMAAMAQAFPTKPIQLIIPFAPGGASDVTIRALAKAAEAKLGQPVVVVNKAAGGGASAMQEVARSEPDGYTLVNFTAIQAAIAPHMRATPYDAVNDFTPIMLYGAFNTFVAVRADSPYKTLADLTGFAQKNPRVLTIGISVIGASSHLGMARLASEAKAQVTFVPFGGGAPAITALLGRHITSAVTSGEVVPYVRSGDLRLLATLMARRVAEFPDVPAVRELGYDWDMSSWLGIAGPAKLPPEILATLEAAFLGAMEDASFKRVMDELAVATLKADAASSRRTLDQDYASFGELMKSLQLGRYAPG